MKNKKKGWTSQEGYGGTKPLHGYFCFKQLNVSNITFLIELFLLHLKHEET
jgi:hypothetical protein